MFVQKLVLFAQVHLQMYTWVTQVFDFLFDVNESLLCQFYAYDTLYQIGQIRYENEVKFVSVPDKTYLVWLGIFQLCGEFCSSSNGFM